MLTGTATVYYNNTFRASAQSADTVGREFAPTANDASYALAKRLLGENCRLKQMPESPITRKSANRMSAYSANASVISDRMDIVSDEIGNPVNIGGTLLEWNGRQLQSVSDEYMSITYAYNTDGQRVKKVLSSVEDDFTHTYEYYYNGEILAGQKVTKVEDGAETTYTLAFMYDSNGDAFGFYYNDTPYYYVKNAQNDVVLIMDEDGQTVVLYQYDVWGKITQYFDSSDNELGLINPLFYRSYYLDLEMEMYYLNSRYYLSGLHRFLNADDVEILDEDQDSLIENNLFAYCLNNPINMEDKDGEVASRIIGGVVGGALGLTAGYLISKHFNLTGGKRAAVMIAATVVGAACGALIGPYVAKVGKRAVAKAGAKYAAKKTTKVSLKVSARTLSKSFKTTAKISKQMSRRGWTNQLIRDTIKKNIARPAFNKATGNAATAFFTGSGATGAYVVIDNVTREIIQISNRLDPNWVIDQTIRR